MRRGQRRDHRSPGGLADQVGLLQRIIQDIEQTLTESPARTGGQLGADEFEDGRGSLFGVQPEQSAAGTAAGHQRGGAEIGGLPTVGGPEQLGPEIEAVQGSGVPRGDRGGRTQGREPVGHSDELLAVGDARGQHPGPTDGRGRVDASVEEIPLVAPQRQIGSTGGLLSAIVPEEHHHGVGGVAAAIDLTQHPTQGIVHVFQGGEEFLPVHVGGSDRGMAGEVFGRGAHRPMDRVERQVEHEGFQGIPFLQAAHRPVGQQVGRPPLIEVGLTVLPPVEGTGLLADVGEVVDGTGIFAVMEVPAAILRLVFQVLPDDRPGDARDRHVGFRVVEPAQMPFAAHEGLVSRGTEGLRQRVLLEAQSPGIVHRRADGMAAGQQGRSGDAADRRRVEAFESDALAAQAVHVRRFGEATVSPQVAEAVIVGHHDDHIGTGRGHGDREPIGGAQGRRPGVGDDDLHRMDPTGLIHRRRPVETAGHRIHRSSRQSRSQAIRQRLGGSIGVAGAEFLAQRSADPDLLRIGGPCRKHGRPVGGPSPAGTSAPGEPHQHLIVEDQIGGPDEPGPGFREHRGEARVGRLVVHTDLRLGERRGPRPCGIVEGRSGPIGGHGVMQRPGVGAGIGIEGYGRGIPRAIGPLHHQGRVIERRDVEGLGPPIGAGHRAIAEAGHETAVSRMERIASVEFGAEPQILFPVHQTHRVGHGAFGPETHHARVERGVRHRIHGDPGAVHVQFEVVVGEQVPGDHLAVRIDGHHRDRIEIHAGDPVGPESADVVVQVGGLGAVDERRGCGDRPDRPIPGRDPAHRRDALSSGKQVARDEGRRPPGHRPRSGSRSPGDRQDRRSAQGGAHRIGDAHGILTGRG